MGVRYAAVLSVVLGLAAAAAGAAVGDIDVAVGPVTPTAATPRDLSLATPFGIAFDAAGNYYVSETSGHRIRKITPTTHAVVAGTGSAGFAGDGGQATAAALTSPRGLAIDGAGNLYVADSGNHRVRRVTPAGVITTVAGTGTAGSAGDNGPATSAQLNRPVAVAIDGLGRLFIAEFDGHRVRMVSGGTITTIAGDGTAGRSGDGGPATAALLTSPTSLAFDPSGVLHVLEYGSRVRRIAADGTITRVAGRLGGFDAGDGGPAVDAEFYIAQAIAFDSSGRLLIGGYLRVRRVDLSGIVSTIAGSDFTPGFAGDGGPAPAARFNQVGAMAFDPLGNLHFSDTGNNRIRRIDTSSVIDTVAGGGGTSLKPCPADGTLAVEAMLDQAAGTATDAQGRLYVAAPQARCVFRVEADGRTTRVAGGGASGAAFEGIPARDAFLTLPRAIAFDAAGNLLIADWYVVRKVGGDGVITRFAGLPVMAGYGGDGGAAREATFRDITSIATDAEGNLFIADSSNNRVRKVRPDGVVVTVAGSGESFGSQQTLATASPMIPVGVASDRDGGVFITTNSNNVFKADRYGQLHRIVGPPPGSPAPSGLGDGGPATAARLQTPNAVALDADGNLYIADRGQQRVRVVSTDATITTVAGTGVAGGNGDGGPAAAAQLDNPWYLSIGANGGLLVSVLGQMENPARGRVRRIQLPDRVPDPFTFTSLQGVAPATPTQSAPIVPVGFDSTASIEVSFGGEYSIGCTGTFTTARGTFEPGQSVCVRHTSGANANQSVVTRLWIEGRAADFTSTTAPAAGAISLTPPTLSFGGQSMNNPSPSQTVTVTNTGATTVTINSVRASNDFTATHACTTLAPQETCAVQVVFRPFATGARSGTLTVQATSGSPIVPLDGVGEASFVRHYYQAILGREPDEPGRLFWEQEATRVTGLGANINEVWFALATQFFFSAEYSAFQRSNVEFVTDLYRTFFGREPDTGGRDFWTGQLDSGMPREVLLASFTFSIEFTLASNRTFGVSAVRAELDMVTDFYRGLLARLPDDTGFAFWRQRFRTAQCNGSAAVTAAASDISREFLGGGEYTGRNRTTAQYVGDLYNAFLRRGGDLAGVQFWIEAIQGGKTRDQVLQGFVDSGEFKARVAAVTQAGCLP